MKRTAVVLVNWNGWRDTIECLASLMSLADPPQHIFVVDNASRDDSIVRIEAWCRREFVAEAANRAITPKGSSLAAPTGLRWATVNGESEMPADKPQLVIVRSSTNRGFAGGNNLGIALALSSGVDFVWLLNTDTVVDAMTLGALLDRACARPDAGIVGSTLLYYWRPTDVQAFGGASFDARNGTARHLGANLPATEVPSDPGPVEAQMDYVVGASMLVTRAFLEAIGPMCEDYFLYFEEIDWAVRARGRFAMAYAPASRVFHKVGGSSRKAASRLSLRYLYRNRLRFMAKFFPTSLAAVRRTMVLQFFQHLRRGHWHDVLEIAGALVASNRRVTER